MAEMWVNMGPQHPMTHGLWTLKVKIDGETITDAIPEVGYLHRGIEKIMENRTFPQSIPLADRLCYGSAHSWSSLYVFTVEDLMGVVAPERAQYIRVITLEIQRIINHLLWLAAYAADLGILTMFLYPMRERELFMDLMQMISGGRLMYDYTRIGGVRNDTPDRFEEETLKQIAVLEQKLQEYEGMMDDNDMILMRTMDVGILRPDDAIDLGVTGPNLRASGVPYDLRRHDPYLVYDKLDFAICVEKRGDCYSRYRVRMNEMRESMSIIKQALKDMPAGPIMAQNVPKKAPKGSEVFTRTADPRGDSSIHMIGNGTDKPYRVDIKSPAFINISASPTILIGNRIADVPSIMGSIDVCIGETDR